jgi:hypothetical protein
MNPIRRKSMDWTDCLGVSESQHSLNCDSESCVSFAACHVLESQIQFLTGQKVKLSPRFLASVSHTTIAGNTFQNVYNAIVQYGICTEDTWPIPAGLNWSWSDFYKTPPPQAYSEALWFKQQFNVALQAKISPQNLVSAPLWTEVNLGYTTHAVEQINLNTELDSEPNLAPPGHGGDTIPYLKPLAPVVHYNLLLLTQKVSSNVQFIQNGNGEYGFFVPATSPQTLIDKALNYSINIQNPDGSVAFNQAKQITGL